MVRVRPSRLIVLAGIGVVLLMVLGAGAAVWQLRNQAIEDSRHNLASLSLVLSEHALQTVKGADLVLDAIAEEVSALGLSDQETFNWAMSRPNVYQMLRERSASLPQIDVTTIVASDGRIVNFSRSYPPPPINLSDRDYFMAHRDQSGVARFVSVPVRNRGTGTWTFYLSRRLSTPSGEFLGLALTGLKVDFFEKFYEAVSLGADSALSLYRRDGTLLARYPVVDGMLGRSFKSGAVFREVIDHADHGTAVVRGPRVAYPFDTDLRIVAPRALRELPLVVNITLTERDFLSQWRNSAWTIGAAVLASVAIVGLLVLVVVRLVARREVDLATLIATKREAEEASRAKSDFLAMMSHEIRTPLNGVLGLTEQVLNSPLADQQRGVLNAAHQSAQALLVIIDDILDFSKIEAGQLQIERTVFEPRQLLAEVASMLGVTADAKGLALDVQAAQSLPQALLGDPVRIRQIVTNLATNAVKFTTTGHVRVRLDSRSGTEPEVVVLCGEVVDTGIGIDPAVQPLLFTRFTQADASTTRRFGGTGLGLAICKRLCELMNGAIGVESEPGQGSRFWFEVECQAADAAEVAKSSLDEEPAPRRPLRVLVAEDNRINQMVILGFLRQLNHRAELVDGGTAAVAAVAAKPYDLVLMDINMPGMDGMEAARRIRALPAPAGRVPIIALTADVVGDRRQTYLAAGMVDVLTKPLSRQALAAALARNLPDAIMPPVVAAQAPGAADDETSSLAESDKTALADLARRLEDAGRTLN
jgi:signal transduction histidine kinase/DNA-binding response OmpR family regulator